jgi:hypothetical protein
MFRITTRAVVNSLVWEMKSDLPDSLGSEPNHTAHDPFRSGSICSLRIPKLISENGIL